MNKQITSVRLGVVVVLALAALAGISAGIALPAAPAAAPAPVGSQAVNYFRNLLVKPADDSVAISVTQYTTPTVNPLSINSSSGAALFTVDGTGAVSAKGAAITGTFTVSGYQMYPVSYWDMDGVNGAMAAHGLPGAPTYPHCMLYTPIYPVTVTVYISAANATSVTLAMVDFEGSPYTGDPLAVRCSAVYVP